MIAGPDLPRFMLWSPLCGEEFRNRIEPEHGGNRMIVRLIAITCTRTDPGELTGEPHLQFTIDDNEGEDRRPVRGAFRGSAGGTRGYRMRT